MWLWQTGLMPYSTRHLDTLSLMQSQWDGGVCGVTAIRHFPIPNVMRSGSAQYYHRLWPHHHGHITHSSHSSCITLLQSDGSAEHCPCPAAASVSNLSWSNYQKMQNNIQLLQCKAPSRQLKSYLEIFIWENFCILSMCPLESKF